jgi:hypothetical protein
VAQLVPVAEKVPAGRLRKASRQPPADAFPEPSPEQSLLLAQDCASPKVARAGNVARFFRRPAEPASGEGDQVRRVDPSIHLAVVVVISRIEASGVGAVSAWNHWRNRAWGRASHLGNSNSDLAGGTRLKRARAICWTGWAYHLSQGSPVAGLTRVIRPVAGS